MKFRTDFVTNSSSSSFLLAEGYDEEKFRKHIRKKVKEFEKMAAEHIKDGPYISWEYEDLAYQLRFRVDEMKDIGEIETEGIDEIMSWYEDEILDPIQQKIQRGEEPDEAEVKKIFQWTLLTYAMGSVDSQEDYTAKVSKDAVQNAFAKLANMESWEWEQRLYKFCEIVCANNMEFMAYGEKIAEEGYTYSRLVKDFLGCSKAFWDDLETHYLVIGAVAEFEDCRFSCNHMG